MKKLIFLILASVLLFSLIGITNADIGKITAYVINPDQGSENDSNNGQGDNMMVGNDRDEHGCIGSAGYTWCESKGKCLRSWEENCTSVKIMPSTASTTAIARLGIKNCNESEGCTIVMKETGTGNETKATYEVKAKKEAKLFGFIKTSMDVAAEVDAETGEVISTKGPWWRIFAVESND
jgi:hypothetical protein